MPAGAQWETCLLRGELCDAGTVGTLGQAACRSSAGGAAAGWPRLRVRQRLLPSFCLEEPLPRTEARRIFCLGKGLGLARSRLCVRWFLLSSEWCSCTSPFPLVHTEDYRAHRWSIMAYVTLPLISTVLLGLLWGNNNIQCG